MATKSQGFSSPNATSTPSTGFFNKAQGVGTVSAAVGNALNSRARGRGPSNVKKQALDNKLTFAKDFGVAFGQNFGKAALDTGQSILKSPLRVGASLAEIPRVIGSKGAKTFDPYNIPFLGEVKTYSREAQDKIKAGSGSKLDTASAILGSGGQAILDTALLGGAAKGAKEFAFGKGGTTSSATNVMRKIAPKSAAKFDQLTYRMYKGAPMGWQLRAQKAMNLPFWKMNPNL